jgi:hypothetical protein
MLICGGLGLRTERLTGVRSSPVKCAIRRCLWSGGTARGRKDTNSASS